jgi:hypothetical protein
MKSMKGFGRTTGLESGSGLYTIVSVCIFIGVLGATRVCPRAKGISCGLSRLQNLCSCEKK